ncbi:hypothetical protein DWG18_02345 [Lysobacter sp. TY2-98]|uniref:hypothetical protein n=1 Tax=Lysobacter sp. TY2-98 TaxID=2290922 RepID=UPI000E1FC797|nr:hypothetical protein [Lysobacter sp. TY2-98]AXK71240.1 hypothetical protein DWG18_02345 [Lysobacter sp. TY2-98]
MESLVTVRIANLRSRVQSTKELVPFSRVERDEVVVTCPPGVGESLNDQLVWLWSALKPGRRALAKLQSEGAVITCHYSGPSHFILKPNGAEFLHLMGVELVVG